MAYKSSNISEIQQDMSNSKVIIEDQQEVTYALSLGAN